jgi:hypothetical protein
LSLMIFARFEFVIEECVYNTPGVPLYVVSFEQSNDLESSLSANNTEMERAK